MPDQTIVAALPGYVEIRYTPPAVGKVTVSSIKEMMRAWPVVAFKISAHDCIPVTTHDTAPTDGEVRVLVFPTGIIVDAEGTQFRSWDAWAQNVETRWRAAHPPRSAPAFAVGTVPNIAPEPAQPRSGWAT